METEVGSAPVTDAAAVKSCCAAVYQSDWACLLLGDSFHPGGLALTERLGQMLELGPGQRVLDVAAGTGASAIFLAQRFGCAIIGVDYGAAAVIADARPTEEYTHYLKSAGLIIDRVEPHDDALTDLVRDIRAKLLGAELLVKLKQIDLPGADFDQAKTLARAAADAVRAGQLCYAIVVATKPA